MAHTNISFFRRSGRTAGRRRRRRPPRLAPAGAGPGAGARVAGAAGAARRRAARRRRPCRRSNVHRRPLAASRLIKASSYITSRATPTSTIYSQVRHARPLVRFTFHFIFRTACYFLFLFVYLLIPVLRCEFEGIDFLLL